MSETLDQLEDEIRTFLLEEGKEEMITGGFKISMEDERIKITRLPRLNLKQLRLPLEAE